MKASNTGEDDEFGYSVSLSSDGNTLAVGANGEDSQAEGIGAPEVPDDNVKSSSGAVYLY